MMTAFEQTAALNAAIRVGLFTAVAHGAHDADLLAKRCGCAPRAARILADVLTVHGLLTKQEGRYALAADAALFLVAPSPSYIGEAARFLASPEKIDLYFTDPEGWATRGGPAGLANVTPESSVWVDFARGMANFMAPVATGVAEMLQVRLAPAPSRILDIAAGHGLFGISCLKVFPGSEVVAMDWAPVLAVAADTAAYAGVEDRWKAQPGSAFDLEARAAYDLVLVPNFLHHFDPPTCVAFLRQVAETLKPGGVAAPLVGGANQPPARGGGRDSGAPAGREPGLPARAGPVRLVHADRHACGGRLYGTRIRRHVHRSRPVEPSG